MDVCKRETKNCYSCYVFDYDHKYVLKKGYDQNNDLHWQLVNYGSNVSRVIRLDCFVGDTCYDLVDSLYNEIINSKKDSKEDNYYIDDITEYENFNLYSAKDDFIHWVSDTGKINSEELYILKNDNNYSIVFIGNNPRAKNIKIVFSTENSKYGNFSEAFRRDFGRTMDIAYDNYDECFEKIQGDVKQYSKKVVN